MPASPVEMVSLDADVLDKGLVDEGLLIIGCGLIGTSLAAAVRQSRPQVRITGVERSHSHREVAAAKGIFDTVCERLDECGGERYGIAVLAVPVEAAVALLPVAARRARIVMDVCSVKQPLCEAAARHGLGEVYAPTHPMAGRAAGGPAAADAGLFAGCTWLTVAGYPAIRHVLPLVRGVGGIPVSVATAREHDLAMAAVSHGVHVASLSVMLAYDRAQRAADAGWASWTGPGFRDVTRLSASPPGFWPDTLRANRDAVVAHLDELMNVLAEWRRAIAADDAARVLALLREAQAAHERWQMARRGDA